MFICVLETEMLVDYIQILYEYYSVNSKVSIVSAMVLQTDPPFEQDYLYSFNCRKPASKYGIEI